MSRGSTTHYPIASIAAAAASAPSLLAYNLSPSPTFLNQALALGLWAAFVLVCRASGRASGVMWPLCLALVGVGLGAGGSLAIGHLPSGLALSALGLLFAAIVMGAAGVAARAGERAEELLTAFATAWLIAGLLNLLVAGIQVFTPSLADGNFIATTNLPGRAVGNLRQPNHLSSLLLWSVIAAVALLEMRKLSLRLAAALVAMLVFGIVLTASRTGVISIVLLALWGALDKRLAPRTRWLLLAAPVLYALAWAGMAQWAELTRQTFGGAERITEDMGRGVDYSSSRFTIWAHTWALIKDSPWFGVGFGEFNYAWTLTSFPDRPKAFFDHTHNLPLQLAVELGLPLAGAVMALLLWALWRAARGAWQAPDADAGGIGARACVVMVVMVGLHSLLEYPLWYAYFLLPTAWAWGFALGRPAPAAQPPAGVPAVSSATATRASWALPFAATAVLLGAVLAVLDYTRVVAIFSSSHDTQPLVQRIEAGRRSVLFSHHADYAAVTSGVALREPAASFANTTHYLLDGRLMIAWAEWLEANGQPDLARHLAGRLREFRSPDAVEFFEPCPERALPAAEAASLPFQCQLPQRTPHWREYQRR